MTFNSYTGSPCDGGRLNGTGATRCAICDIGRRSSANRCISIAGLTSLCGTRSWWRGAPNRWKTNAII